MPWIVRHGAGAFAAIGAARRARHDARAAGRRRAHGPGIVEVPLGATLREVSTAPGGSVHGHAEGRPGGRAHGRLPAADGAGHCPRRSTPWRRRAPWSAQARCWPSTTPTCLVELATLLTRYLSDEACGKTIPCRIGTRRLSELGDAFCGGHARPTDATLFGDLARDMRDAALCGLEAQAANPLLSGMRYFAAEFEDHVLRGHCPAGVCQPVSLAGAAR